MEMEQIRLEAETVLGACVDELVAAGQIEEGGVIVLGCSTSEVAGGLIGKNSVPELGDAIAETMIETCKALGLRPVFQCCEHLNRALVMEQETLDCLRLHQVNVMPVPKAGGSVGAAAYQRFTEPAVAVNIQADAAIDVGDTLVGMHLRPVAVPLRMGEGETKVGEAHVVMAYSRLPFIGGSRAQYPEK